jgi:RNA polymerase sigma-70 factor, ECF subfamily
MTDQELLQGLLNHNRSVCGELISKYQKKIIRTCYSLVHNEEDAKDLAQDVFFELLDSAASFRGSSKLSTWIYRIAINKSLNFLNKHKKKSLFEQIESVFKTTKPEKYQPIYSHFTADKLLEDKERKKILTLAIDSLPVNQRISFTLCKYEELSYKEISEIMNIRVTAVESLIHRAKLNLQTKLVKYYESNK